MSENIAVLRFSLFRPIKRLNFVSANWIANVNHFCWNASLYFNYHLSLTESSTNFIINFIINSFRFDICFLLSVFSLVIYILISLFLEYCQCLNSVWVNSVVDVNDFCTNLGTLVSTLNLISPWPKLFAQRFNKFDFQSNLLRFTNVLYLLFSLVSTIYMNGTVALMSLQNFTM